MADFPIRVVVRPNQAKRGIEEVDRSLKGVQDTATKLRQQMEAAAKPIRLQIQRRQLDQARAGLRDVTTQVERLRRLRVPPPITPTHVRVLRTFNRNARTTVRRLRDITLGTRRAKTENQGLANAFRAVGAAIAVRTIVDAGRRYQLLERRILSVSDSAEDAARNLDLVRRVSNETGTGIEQNASVFARLTIATRNLGIDSERTAGILRTLNQAFVIGGSSGEEIRSAVTQLSQGLASGRLQGDELRTVLESAPLLAEELAKQLGVGIGELREMGAQGRLTSQVLTGALEGAAEGINARFSELPQTIDQSIERFKNAFLDLGRELQPFINLLSDRIAQAAGILRSFNDRAQGRDAERRLESQRLDPTRRFAAGPADLSDTNTSVAIEQIAELTGRNVNALRDLIGDTNLTTGDITRLLDDLNFAITKRIPVDRVLDSQLEIAQRATSLIQSGLIDSKQVAEETIQAIDNANSSRSLVRGFLDEGLPGPVASARTRIVRNNIEGFRVNDENAGNVAFQALRQQLAGGGDLGDLEARAQAALDRAREFEQQVQDTAQNVAGFVESALGSFFGAAADGIGQLNQTIAGAQVLGPLREEAMLLELSATEREAYLAIKEAEASVNETLGTSTFRLNDAQRQQIQEQVFQNAVLREKAQILADLGPSEEEQLIRTEALGLAAQQLGITVDDLKRKMAEAAEDQGQSFIEMLKQATKEASNLEAALFRALDTTVTGLADATAEFAITVAGNVNNAKEAFDVLRESVADILANIGKQILSQIIQALILRAITASVGGFSAPIPGAANGGAPRAGRPYVVAERGPEAFIPPSSPLSASVSASRASRRTSTSIARSFGRVDGGGVTSAGTLLGGPLFKPPGQGNILPAQQTAALMASLPAQGGGQTVVQAPAPEVAVNVAPQIVVDGKVFRQVVKTNDEVRTEVLNLVRTSKETR